MVLTRKMKNEITYNLQYNKQYTITNDLIFAYYLWGSTFNDTKKIHLMEGNAIILLQMLSIFWVIQFTKIRMPLKQKSARFARCFQIIIALTRSKIRSVMWNILWGYGILIKRRAQPFEMFKKVLNIGKESMPPPP